MIPIATTTITVLRPSTAATGASATMVDPFGEGYDTDSTPGGAVQTATSYWTVVSGVRAVIGSPSGSERRDGGSQETVRYTLNCDLTTQLSYLDQVKDTLTGEIYEVEYVIHRHSPIAHTKAGLKTIKGLA